MDLLLGANRKIINATAQSHWVLGRQDEDEGTAQTGAPDGVCEVTWSEGAGRALSALGDYGIGETVIAEVPLVVQIGGAHRNRVCHTCKTIGLKKACVSEDCKNLFFCSRECLSRASDFTDKCGKLVDEIFSNIPHEKDQALLLVEILYLWKYDTNFDLSKTLDMELRPGVAEDSSADAVFEACCRHAPFLVSADSGLSLVRNILRAIKYNVQSLPIPSLPSTYFLCLFETASKFNHSCSPNLRVVYGLTAGVLNASLTCISPIRRGDELRISYINALNLRVADRQALLSKGFDFSCNCQRCYNEMRSPLGLNFPFQGTKNELSSLRNWCADGTSIMSGGICDIVDLMKIIMQQVESYESAEPMETFGRASVSLYDVSEVAAAGLQRLKVLRANTIGISAVKSADQLLVAHLIWQACYVISTCWSSFGGGYNTEKLNVLVFGLSVASQHIENGRSLDAGLKNKIEAMCRQTLDIITLETSMLVDDRKRNLDGSLECIYEKMKALAELMLKNISL
jgi:hypothetical protein